MSWHYLQEPEGEYSVESYAVTLASELVRSKNIPGKSCSNGNGMESYPGFQSGMTSAHSEATTPNAPNTLTISEALPESLLSRAVSRARIFPPLERAQALKEVGRGSGVKWRELSAKFDPQECSWKTHRCLFQEVLQPSSVILPKWGMMLNGVCWELMTQGLHTKERESGYLPTPTCADAVQGAILNENTKLITLKSGKLRKISNNGISGSIGLARTVQLWPTPRAYESTESMKTILARREKTGQGHVNLTAVVKSHGGKKIPQKAQLNPSWVEWLMGWPIGWTDLKPLAMDRFRQWLNSHGKH